MKWLIRLLERRVGGSSHPLVRATKMFCNILPMPFIIALILWSYQGFILTWTMGLLRLGYLSLSTGAFYLLTYHIIGTLCVWSYFTAVLTRPPFLKSIDEDGQVTDVEAQLSPATVQTIPANENLSSVGIHDQNSSNSNAAISSNNSANSTTPSSVSRMEINASDKEANENGDEQSSFLRDMARSFYGPKYCKVCQIMRPERAHHCTWCERCVRKMDHHCPWIGNCVGSHNYKAFVLMLMYTAMFSLFVGGCIFFNHLSHRVRDPLLFTMAAIGLAVCLGTFL